MGKIIFLDTETGGTDASKHSLLEVYLEARDESSLYKTDYMYAKTIPNDGNMVVTSGALRVNNLDLSKHESEAMPYSRACTDLYSFLRDAKGEVDAPLLRVAGWNLAFDLDFLFRQMGVNKKLWDSAVSYRVLDVQVLAEFLKLKGIIPPEVAGLHKTAAYFGINTMNAHTAKADVEITIQVYNKLMELIATKKVRKKKVA